MEQVEGPDARRSRAFRVRQAETQDVSPVRSQYYLPTPRAALKLPFLDPFSALEVCSEQSRTFLRGNLHFPPGKLRLSSEVE